MEYLFQFLCTALAWKGLGAKMNPVINQIMRGRRKEEEMLPATGSEDGCGYPSHDSNVNIWTNLVKIRKSSVLARDSPRHTLFPTS